MRTIGNKDAAILVRCICKLEKRPYKEESLADIEISSP